MIRLGLMGFPLAHSLSPRIHAAALRACGLSGSYDLYPIPPQDSAALQALLHRLRTGHLQGLNITIPHKQTVLPYLDVLTPTAQAVGAVNTIFVENELLLGDNTDAPGFYHDLQRLPIPLPTLPQPGDRTPAARSPQALILGAGGSARAVIYALVSHGWQVHVLARRIQQAQALAALYPTHVTPHTFDHLSHLASRVPIHLVVNTTPLGMHPNIAETPWPASLPFPPGAAIYDLVYNPRNTRLVQHARAAGHAAISGLGMLVEQAALAFERWTGQRPPRDALFAALEES